VIDRFQVARHYRDGVDGLRKQEVKRLKQELPKEAHNDLKRTLWPFRKREAALDETEQERLEALLSYSPALRHADRLREQLTAIFDTARSKKDGLRRIECWRRRVEKSGLRCFDSFLRGRLEIPSTNDTHLCQCCFLACVWPFLVTWWRQIAQHALNRRPIDPRGAILGQMFNILAQAPAALDPGNRALDDPPARLDLKADLSGRARDNLDRDTKHAFGPFDQVAPVALVGPSIGHGRTQIVGLVQCSLHTVPILTVRGRDCHGQQIAFCIDNHLALAPIDLLAAVKTAFTASFCGFDRLAIQDDGGWFTLTPLLRSHGAAQAIVNLQQGAVVVPFVEIVAHGARRRSRRALSSATDSRSGPDTSRHRSRAAG
jgi:hypothetical protein